ncbi:MAG: hypothetical protein IAE77_24900, partial [Prosthecobacter sp.]|uniref:hypothetical protein n=1 Tax=Prosthecobacter sp. TaxID=1965333 RepID=UPI0019FE3206
NLSTWDESPPVKAGVHVLVDLIDENVGRTAVYFPSQAAFRDSPRWIEGDVQTAGVHKQRVVIDPRALEVMRRMKQETNPSHLGDLPSFEILRD